MKSQVLHTVWCNISGEAAGEIWNWSLLGTTVIEIHFLVTVHLQEPYRSTEKLAGDALFPIRLSILNMYFIRCPYLTLGVFVFWYHEPIGITMMLHVWRWCRVACVAGVPVRFRKESFGSRTGARKPPPTLRSFFPRPSPTPERILPETNGNVCSAGYHGRRYSVAALGSLFSDNFPMCSSSIVFSVFGYCLVCLAFSFVKYGSVCMTHGKRRMGSGARNIL